MKVAAARADIRPTAKRKPPVVKHETFPSPKGGWVTNVELATNDKLSCAVLDNFFPEQDGIRPRGGAERYATLHASAAVESLFSYEVGTVKKFFGATETDIFEITSPADADTIPTADVTSLTGGTWVTALIANAGGTWLRAVNGMDTPLTYDGSAWSTSPAITGVTAANLSYVHLFKHRPYFIEKDTLSIWYLGTDAIGGAATEFPLVGVVKKGGALVFLASWAQDSGSGRGELFIAVTDQGEAVVYDGADPSSWTLVNIYDIGLPLGAQAHIKAGGDLVVATEDGMIPFTAATRKDVAALSLDSVARAIEPDWKEEVRTRADIAPWFLLKWPRRNMCIVGLPNGSDLDALVYVVNLQTGRWARYTGWSARCAALFDGQAYIGTTTGRVLTAEQGGSDDGAVYHPLAVLRFNDLGLPGVWKTSTLMRATWRTKTPFNAKLSVSTGYTPSYGAFPAAPADLDESLWDVGKWDIALWDAGGTYQVTTYWEGVDGGGFAFGPNIQMTYGGERTPEVKLISVGLAYTSGSPFV